VLFLQNISRERDLSFSSARFYKKTPPHIIEAVKGREYSAGQEKNGRAVYYVFYAGLRRTMR
jgi:hypothetical protein